MMRDPERVSGVNRSSSSGILIVVRSGVPIVAHQVEQIPRDHG